MCVSNMHAYPAVNNIIACVVERTNSGDDANITRRVRSSEQRIPTYLVCTSAYVRRCICLQLARPTLGKGRAQMKKGGRGSLFSTFGELEVPRNTALGKRRK